MYFNQPKISLYHSTLQTDAGEVTNHECGWERHALLELRRIVQPQPCKNQLFRWEDPHTAPPSKLRLNFEKVWQLIHLCARTREVLQFQSPGNLSMSRWRLVHHSLLLRRHDITNQPKWLSDLAVYNRSSNNNHSKGKISATRWSIGRFGTAASEGRGIIHSKRTPGSGVGTQVQLTEYYRFDRWSQRQVPWH